MGKPVEVTDANFEQEILKSNLPVMVDFWATWCAPCRMIAPIVEELATEYEGKLKVAKLDVDNNQGTSIKYGVRSIPTLLFFKNGQQQEQLIGAVPKKVIVEKIEALLS